MIPADVNNLRELRIKKGMSLEQVAEKLDISFGYVSLLERGLRGMSADRMVEFSKLYGVTLNDIQKLRQSI